LDNSIAVQCPKAGERDSKSCWLRSIRRGCANFFGGIFGEPLRNYQGILGSSSINRGRQ